MNTNGLFLNAHFKVPYTSKELNSFILINNLEYKVTVEENKLDEHSRWLDLRKEEGGGGGGRGQQELD